MNPTVDVHAHLIVPEVEALVADHPLLQAQRELDRRRNGDESTAVSARMVRERLPLLTDVGARLAAMDEAGIDVQVLSPSPSQYHYWADRELAGAITLTANRGVADVVARAPDRFSGFGTVPLQHPDLAARVLDDALGLGLVGVEISSHAPTGTGTVELSDPGLEPFWARVEQRGAVVFLHPFGCTLDQRLDRFYLANTVGQPVEAAVALSHLVFGGVLDRYPRLRLVVAHGGGYLPTSLGRSDHAWEVRPEARACALRPSEYLRRLHFDSLVHSPEALRALVAAAGAEQVLLGSDFPFDMGVPDPVARLAAAGLPPAAQRAVRGGNAVRLGLVPAHTTVKETA